MSKKKKFVIVDAMALAYKAYFAFITRPLTTSKGVPVSAVFGFATQLLKIIDDTKPDYLAIAFDSKEKTFRHERYDLYKSSRSDMPEDMVPQIGLIRDLIEAFDIPLYIKPGYEADDIVGTALLKAEQEGYLSYAVTPDKDYIQLITENCKVVIPGKSNEDLSILDIEKVKKDLGFEPKQMIDYLALVGDSSDDIPGVAGVGPKTATPLIQEFGSVENIYDNIESISKKGLKNKLESNKENALLSKELATIVTDVPIEINFENAKFDSPDLEKIKDFFAEMEFKNLGNRLDKIFGNTANSSESEETNLQSEFDKNKVDYKLINNIEDAKEYAKQLSLLDKFVFDTETDSLNTFHVNLAGVAFSVKSGEAVFIATNPYKTSDDLFAKDLSDRIDVNEFIKIFKPVFENKKIKKICQNGKYDLAVLRSYNVNVGGFYFDTMLASYIIDPDEKHGMDALSEKYLGYTPISIKTIIGDKKSADKIFEADLDTLKDYSCEDADITYRLYELFEKKLEEIGLAKLAYDVEFPLAEVLDQMERTGIKIDQKSLAELSSLLQKKIDTNTEKIHELAEEKFNINSPKQLQVILFEKLQLPPTKKTKTGYSTDAGSLDALKGQHEIIDLLLEFRQASKLKSTYSDALPKLIEPKTNRIHTTFNQTIASTGRLSSLDPNLQNIPIRTEQGKLIRKAFIAKDSDYILFAADYSQIELRIMASICKDPGLQNAFNNNEDIHRSTAAHVFMVDPEEVTADMRRKAKEVNFGILYGIGAFGLKNRLGITQAHAKEIIDTYFETFKNVKQFIDSSIESAKEKGYSETLMGRRRYLKNINSSNRVVRQFEERVAINMPIQGTAADMIKVAMINIHNELNKRETKSKMLLQVHDELVFDMHKSELEELAPIIVDLMETALPLNVPVKVDTGTGSNWLEAH